MLTHHLDDDQTLLTAEVIHHLPGEGLHLLRQEAAHLPLRHAGLIDRLPGPLPEGCVVVLSEGVLPLLLGAALLEGPGVRPDGLLLVADVAALLFVGLFVHVQNQFLQGGS